VDANWNSAYPYVVGPTFYGVRNTSKVQTIGETVTTYNPVSAIAENDITRIQVNIFPNPADDFFAVQVEGLLRERVQVYLLDASGKVIQQAQIMPGSTICYFETATLYDGVYSVSMVEGAQVLCAGQVVLQRN
jgi:hypothetical protein